MYLLLLLLVALTRACTTSPNLHRPFPDSIDLGAALPLAKQHLTDAFYSLGDIPCLSFGIVFGSARLATFNLGVCNTTTGASATGDTIFRIASLTKLFTDLAAMRIGEETNYHLDTPVTVLEPRFKVKDPFTGSRPSPYVPATAITLRHLGSHLAGLYESSPCTSGAPTCTGEQIYSNLPHTQLVLPVGFRPAYSNFGFSVLGRALENKAMGGLSYENYVVEKILSPIGMKSSGFKFTRDIVERMAMGYGTNSHFTEDGWTAPAGGMYSSVNDLSRFISYILGATKNNTTPVSRQNIVRSLQAHYVFSDGNVAMGFPWEMRRYADASSKMKNCDKLRGPGILFRMHITGSSGCPGEGEGDGSFWSNTKDGNWDGFASSIEIVPELNFGVVCLTNNGPMDAHFLTQPIVKLLAPYVRAKIIESLSPFVIPGYSRFQGTWENSTEGLEIDVGHYDPKMGVLAATLNGNVEGFLEPQDVAGTSSWTFIFRSQYQIPATDTWRIERGCMRWLFDDSDGTEVIYTSVDGNMLVTLVGMADYGVRLTKDQEELLGTHNHRILKQSE